MAMPPDLVGGIKEEETAAESTLFDPASKRSVGSLIRSRIILSVVNPASFPPIRKLAALN
jgi:hypothetical protein